MIWLTLRQFRVQGAVVFAGLAVLGAALALTGPGIADEYREGLASCARQGNCAQFTMVFYEDHRMYHGAVTILVTLVPGLIGVFWGAPLITRELEAGTHRLVWNQSITRTRWLGVKLALVGLAAMVAAGLAVLAVDWWSNPLDEAGAENFSRLTPLLFDARGISPIAHAAFAFALGVTAGVLVRRTLPAMALTLVVFAAVQVAMPVFVRPHLARPESTTVAITSENHSKLLVKSPAESASAQMEVEVEAEPGAWMLVNTTIDGSGREIDSIPFAPLGRACEPPPPGPNGELPDGPGQACFDKLAQQGYRQKVVYQPADRFWPLQWAETGVFAVLTLGLTGLCFYWTRRRVS